MLTANEGRLQRLTKLEKSALGLWREGVSVESHFGRTIMDLVAQVSADRLDLGDSFLTMAKTLHASRSDLSRAAIARYYYAMYHAMRAVSFYVTEGDDHEGHSNLYRAIPADFPNSAIAQNDLKSAREWRNEADYDPYPSNPTYFKSVQKSLAPVAIQFVADCRGYLQAKGNTYA